MSSYRFFLAGIMQGSWQDTSLHDQDYRTYLETMLREHFPGSEIYDPFRNHGTSIEYDDDQGRRVFFNHNRMCREETDVLIAFAPQASMGTAIEMWEAYQSGAAVFTISPMQHNWAIRFLSHGVYEDLETFERAIASGEVGRLIASVLQEERRNPVDDILNDG